MSAWRSNTRRRYFVAFYMQRKTKVQRKVVSAFTARLISWSNDCVLWERECEVIPLPRSKDQNVYWLIHVLPFCSFLVVKLFIQLNLASECKRVFYYYYFCDFFWFLFWNVCLNMCNTRQYPGVMVSKLATSCWQRSIKFYSCIKHYWLSVFAFGEVLHF